MNSMMIVCANEIMNFGNLQRFIRVCLNETDIGLTCYLPHGWFAPLVVRKLCTHAMMARHWNDFQGFLITEMKS
jgi:hypothetical protein